MLDRPRSEPPNQNLIRVILRVQITLDISLKLLIRPNVHHTLCLRQWFDRLYRVVVSLAFYLVIKVLEVVLVFVSFYESFEGRDNGDFNVRKDGRRFIDVFESLVVQMLVMDQVLSGGDFGDIYGWDVGFDDWLVVEPYFAFLLGQFELSE